MKRLFVTLFSLMAALLLFAQSDDPVIMTVNGNEIRKSEFEYFYRKNRTEDIESLNDIKEYAELYRDFKLKVQAAIDAGIDRQEAFLSEYKGYRDIQAENFLVDSAFLEETAHQTFIISAAEVGPDGITELYLLSVLVKEATLEADEAARQTIDSIYSLLVEGEDFRTLAAKHSDDGAARNGGAVGWVSRPQLPEEIGDVLFNLEPNMVSTPFPFENYYVIVRAGGHQDFGKYEDHRQAIYEWMQKQPEILEDAKLSQGEKLSEKYGWDLTPEEALARADSMLETLFPEFGNLSREYYEGLLMFEISNREVWEKAGEDTLGLLKFFKDNRKRYRYDEPRFKGVLVFSKDEETFRNVEQALEDLPYDEWVDTLLTFNADESMIRVMRGPFEKGQNMYVDKVIFGEGSFEPLENWPSVNAVGRMMSAPEEPADLGGQLVNDYQDWLEKQWLKRLKKQYRTKIYKKVLETVLIEG